MTPLLQYPIHTLRWPIEDDKGNQLASVTVKSITLEKGDEITKQYPTELPKDDKRSQSELLSAHNDAYLQAMTGLTATEISRLRSPDYNSLMQLVFLLSSSTTEEVLAYLQGDDYQAQKNPDEQRLLVPVNDAFKGMVSTVHMEPPTVQMTRMVQEFGGRLREEQITAMVTGLDITTIKSLHLPDWLQLSGRVADFLQQGADYFPQPTLTA